MESVELVESVELDRLMLDAQVLDEQVLDEQVLDRQVPDEQAPETVWKRLREDWLILVREAYVHAQWIEQVRDRRRQLAQKAEQMAREPRFNYARPVVLVAEPAPQQFLAAFWAAQLANWTIVLANPKWGLREWHAASRQIQPDLIWGECIPESVFSPPVRRRCVDLKIGAEEPQILIPTGGTSGGVKFASHTWKTLMSSADGFRQYFAPDAPVYSYCVLPLYHVSGLMQVLRSAVSGGQVAIAASKPLERNEAAHPLPFSADFGTGEHRPLRVLSLVPTQLQRLLESDRSAWLKQFEAVLLGGAPPWPALLDAAQAQRIPLSLSYGMTETAAMVTALKPQDFLCGDRSSGAPLPHATVTIIKDGASLPANQVGQIVIKAASIPLSSSESDQTLITDDLGYFSPNGHLHIVGRASQMIISGGENIAPTEVEAAIRSTGKVSDVCVVGICDAEWGEAVAAAYVPQSDAVTVRDLQASLQQVSCQQASLQQVSLQPVPLQQVSLSQAIPILSRYKHPKYWLALKSLPRNAQGKINRQVLNAQIQAQLNLLSN